MDRFNLYVRSPFSDLQISACQNDDTKVEAIQGKSERILFRLKSREERRAFHEKQQAK